LTTEFSTGQRLAQVDDLQAKTQVRLVDAEAFQDILVGQFREWHQDALVRRHRRNQRRDQAFHHVQHVVAFHERHFQIQLSEFGLSIATLILITKTTGNLKISLDTCDHQQLFELLR